MSEVRRRALLLAVCGLMAACGRLGFDAMDGAVGPDTAPFDAPADARDDASRDSSPDAPTHDAGDGRVLSCGALVPASVDPPIEPIVEPGLRLDGRTLVATRDTILVATRPTLDDAFDSWTESMDYDERNRDFTFLEWMGAELGAGSTNVANRRIVLCRAPIEGGTCEPVTVFDADGVEITDDTDGPALAIIDGELVMAFNRGSALYFARPRAPDLVAWDARPIETGGLTADDPTLSDDGMLLLVMMGAPAELYSMVYSAALDTYEAPHRVEGASGGASPELGVASPAGFELFMSGSTRGVHEPHIATCVMR